ncbi:HlyD family secretion protein [Rhodovibrio salinarum]|uniref:HlyD family secretion protein n=1 Tax=Rhodovibrio salinarum TaxID=1087 RepID=A0A934QJE6_9PROT|nr:HlyD family secretion protein [Rhodovibrio salinarum]MBK1697984.1 HlyD family secretion protein [Rhodovibrio salinarum]
MSSLRNQAGRILLTLIMVVCAVLLGRHMWDYYVNAPWTRDGRVTADVVKIAPEVSGTVLQVEVTNNQAVQRGDVLFKIDPSRFRLAVEQAQAKLESSKATLHLKKSIARRRKSLRASGAVSAETVEQATREAVAAEANYREAQAALDLAELNLERATVRAPADGWVTNLHLRPGDYATAGQMAVAMVDADSFRVTGYFLETQLDRIRIGDSVRVLLMGFDPELEGHVESIGHGIADSNDTADQHGLPAVDPVFEWVRLAQRIPVRVRIEDVPSGLPLASGMTASLYVEESEPANRTAEMAEQASRP